MSDRKKLLVSAPGDTTWHGNLEQSNGFKPIFDSKSCGVVPRHTHLQNEASTKETHQLNPKIGTYLHVTSTGSLDKGFVLGKNTEAWAAQAIYAPNPLPRGMAWHGTARMIYAPPSPIRSAPCHHSITTCRRGKFRTNFHRFGGANTVLAPSPSLFFFPHSWSRQRV